MSQIHKTKMWPKQVVIATMCDNCGKKEQGFEPAVWHHFSSHHDEWGNDSCELFTYHDACSPECFMAIARRELDGWWARPPASFRVAKFDATLLNRLIEISI